MKLTVGRGRHGGVCQLFLKIRQQLGQATSIDGENYYTYATNYV